MRVYSGFWFLMVTFFQNIYIISIYNIYYVYAFYEIE